jgi:hypothetical protein
MTDEQQSPLYETYYYDFEQLGERAVEWRIGANNYRGIHLDAARIWLPQPPARARAPRKVQSPLDNDRCGVRGYRRDPRLRGVVLCMEGRLQGGGV